MSTFGERLQRLRSERGLSQEALARAVDVSVRTVARWEAGESGPGLKVAQLVAAALGCKLADFVAPEPEAEAS
jgi:transcriptional regulator with XRE-family HTH domain